MSLLLLLVVVETTVLPSCNCESSSIVVAFGGRFQDEASVPGSSKQFFIYEYFSHCQGCTKSVQMSEKMDTSSSERMTDSYIGWKNSSGKRGAKLRPLTSCDFVMECSDRKPGNKAI